MSPERTTRAGVAISTTGDPHRLALLRTSVEGWDNALDANDALFVTVDGDDEAVRRVAETVAPWTTSVFRVGQPLFGAVAREGRLGVAVNKNTGLELLADNSGLIGPVEHVFLSDDDTWPLSPSALALHTDSPLPHSMVCWGRHRHVRNRTGSAYRLSTQRQETLDYSEWSWPRGVVLYMERVLLDRVGGMIEEFGPGGHEHVEYSRRVYQHGVIPAPYVTPTEYALHGGMGALRFWHAEDARRRGEPLGNHRLRRKRLTSVRRVDGDWESIEKIMAERDGDTRYVPFRARSNGRESATLYHTTLSRGAED